MDSRTIIALAFIAMLAVYYVAGAVRDVLVARSEAAGRSKGE